MWACFQTWSLLTACLQVQSTTWGILENCYSLKINIHENLCAICVTLRDFCLELLAHFFVLYLTIPDWWHSIIWPLWWLIWLMCSACELPSWQLAIYKKQVCLLSMKILTYWIFVSYLMQNLDRLFYLMSLIITFITTNI